MPITQPPTLNVIDGTRNQYSINFGIFMDDDQSNRVPVVVPNIIDSTGTLYTIDLTNVNTPARGNIPWIRSVGFCFDSRQVAGTPAVPLELSAIYMWNPATKQVVSFFPPPSVPNVAYATIINGVVPFFCPSNQSIQIFRESGNAPLDFWIGASFAAFTFDVAPYYEVTSVGWALQPAP